MQMHLVAAAALAQALAWTPAANSARRTPLQAAEETDALAQIQSLEELEADYWSSLDDVERQIQGASRSGAAFLRQGDLEGALEVALPQEGGAAPRSALDLPFYII